MHEMSMQNLAMEMEILIGKLESLKICPIKILYPTVFISNHDKVAIGAKF